MIRKNNHFLIFLVVLLVMAACSPKPVFKQQVKVGNYGWHKDSMAIFNVTIADIEQSYHALIHVQTNATYPYSNIWFFVDALSPSGKMERDTIQGYFSAPNGEWLGEKVWFEDAYVTNQAYKMNIKFPEKGMYTFRIVQGMRDTVLMGIDNVGLSLYKAEK